MKDAVEKQDMIERLGMISYLMPKIAIFGQKYFKNITKLGSIQKVNVNKYP